ncbi:helix-turn-helix domain-containing protein [Citrobacter sp. Cb004]|uniref:helix-turn-helix domain-containing protein n=1 Tax=Citrobacter sp. Cb004 TaxID=2985006 RepID=UPI00336C2F30
MTLEVANEEKISHKVILDTVFWIEADLSRSMSTMIIAERTGYSQWYLQRLFKQITGYSLARYIRLRRLTVAAELLKTSDLSIVNIFVQVGFDDSATFCRVFRRHYGLGKVRTSS